MTQEIPYKFYKVNGAIQLLPSTAQDNQYPEASPQEVQAEIQKYSSGQYANDSWSQNYVKNLSSQLQEVQTGAINNDPRFLHYVIANDGTLTNRNAIDPATGNVRPVQNLGNQQDSPYTTKPVNAVNAPPQTQTLGDVKGNFNQTTGSPTQNQQSGTSASYQIKSGDTLSKIAKQNGMTVQALMKLNPQITDPNKIVAGQSLNLGGETTSTSTSQTSTTTGQSGASSDTSTTVSPVSYNPSWSTYGITSQTWSSLNATQQAVVAAAMNSANSQYSTTGNTITLADALKAAAQDTTIVNQYADATNLTTADFQNTLANISQQAQATAQGQQAQFYNEQKALKDQFASAGQAYSGMRNLAQSQLDTQESGIIQSTRSQIANQLRQAQEAVAQTQGSNFLSTLPNATAGYVNPLTGATENIVAPNMPNNIVGSDVTSKQQAINQLAGEYVTMGKVPNVIPA